MRRRGRSYWSYHAPRTLGGGPSSIRRRTRPPLRPAPPDDVTAGRGGRAYKHGHYPSGEWPAGGGSGRGGALGTHRRPEQRRQTTELPGEPRLCWSLSGPRGGAGSHALGPPAAVTPRHLSACAGVATVISGWAKCRRAADKPRWRGQPRVADTGPLSMLRHTEGLRTHTSPVHNIQQRLSQQSAGGG